MQSDLPGRGCFLFPKGENRIVIISDSAVFEEIDVSITGKEMSDFE